MTSSRLRSLWDMREILAKSFAGAAGHIERMDALIAEWENPAGEGFTSKDQLAESARRGVAQTYARFAAAADVLNAPVTKVAAERAIKRLRERKKPVSFAEMKVINAELSSRFYDEIGQAHLYCLSPGAENYYAPSQPLFGAEVEARIPKAVADISESGKCFGTGRYTASVFHLMRAMEAAVQTLCSDLGIGNIEREWGKLLSDIHKKIEAMEKGRDRDNWSQIHANLYHVKQAWRNDTMHPKATYTEEEAREVFEAMKAFMRHLASMLPISAEELMS